MYSKTRCEMVMPHFRYSKHFSIFSRGESVTALGVACLCTDPLISSLLTTVAVKRISIIDGYGLPQSILYPEHCKSNRKCNTDLYIQNFFR